jgi:hypothetical protein
MLEIAVRHGQLIKVREHGEIKFAVIVLFHNKTSTAKKIKQFYHLNNIYSRNVDLFSNLEYNIFHNGNIGVFHLRIREQLRGDKNISGARIEAIRKEKGIKQVEMIESLALQGVDITSSGLSKIEGQHRGINDYELLAIANTLDVSIDELLGR